MSYFVLFVLLLLGGSISLVEDSRLRQNTYAVYLCFALPCLLLFAGLRGPDVDADYELYSNWFSSLIAGTLGDNPFSKDASFALLGFSVHALGLGIATLLFVYTALCFGTQLLFAQRAFSRRWIALGIFLMLCRFYIPHEMTQIRASVAIPIMSLAILAFAEHRRLRGTLLLLLAATFHFSSLLAVPVCAVLWFGGTFASRRWIAFLAVVAVVGNLAFSKVSLLLAVFARTSDYVTGAYQTTASSLFSVYLLCRIALVLFATLVLWAKLRTPERLLIVCSALGVTMQVALASNDSLAVRSGELFGLFDVASALVLLSYLRGRALVGYVSLLLCLGGVFFRSSTKIVQPYATRLLQ